MTTDNAPSDGKTGVASLQRELLRWYDRHHRDLPWRISPKDRGAGTEPDPYHIWLSEVMLQQTTVAAAGGYFLAFTRRWPRVEDLAAAPLEDVLEAWAGLGYYARARNLHACARIVAEAHGGVFPDTEDELRALPGIGAYTAAAVAAIAFDRPAAVLDGNIERVMARLFAEADPLPGVKPTLYAHAARLTPPARPGDHAQALMDLGATVCTPRSPACGVCPLMVRCEGRRKGIAATLPVKAPKKVKPTRHGWVWALVDHESQLMVVRRPEKGLLGGMLALPSSDWTETLPPPDPPAQADWREIGEVRHTFTHFHLRLTVMMAEADTTGSVTRPLAEAADAMPTVFAKAVRLLPQSTISARNR
ncbi:MAG: A/G-specific adenine glycosylase [Pseudomonadota bacterium]